MLIHSLFKQLALGLLFIASVNFVSNAEATTQVYIELIKAADTKASGKYVRSGFLEALKKPLNPTASKKILIIGDSHAQDFFNAVVENGFLKDYQIRTRYIPTRCQIFLDQGMDKHIPARDKHFCSKSDNLTKAMDQIRQSDVVIFAASWKEWTAKALPLTIKRLELSPQQKLFVIGGKSFGKISIRNYLRMSEQQLRDIRNTVNKDQDKINDLLKNSLDKNVFINIQQLLCGSSKICPVFTNDLKLISFDGGHLTKKGARYVGKILFKNSPLGKL